MNSYCGLECGTCEAYLATKNNDGKLRQETAKKWSAQFNSDIKPEQINCEGCKGQGVKFSHCNECKVRKCNLAKKYENCGLCPDYPCQDVSFIVDNVPPAKEYLEQVRKGRKKS
ncbi:MAG: DUF3795 domain-containing protein [Candidatus Wallbacteria bacterium]|nr:DUF3795 domain-containing protein [Candidatus Wallbacteria bacterium]